MISREHIRYEVAQGTERVRRWFFLPAVRLEARASAARMVLPTPRLTERPRTKGPERSISEPAFADLELQIETHALEPPAIRASTLYCASFCLSSVSAHATDLQSHSAVTSRPQSQAGVPLELSDITQASVPTAIPLLQRLTALLQPPLDLSLSASGPVEWPHEFYDFQKTGIGVLMEKPCVLLADDMGLGKTIQAIAAMRLLIRQGRMERALIAAPAGVLRSWRSELAKWAPELRVLEISGLLPERRWKWQSNVHVKIVSYETLRNDVQLAMAPKPDFPGWDLVCLDEAQRIKNRDSGVSIAARRLQSRRRWALTGTPLENSVEDLRTILSFLLRDSTDGRRLATIPDRDISGILEQVQIRRKKTEVLKDLPAKTITELYVSLTREQRDEYEQLLTGGIVELREKGESVSVTDVLALITRLKQVCNFSLRTGHSSKLDDIQTRLTLLCEEGAKALVFSQYTSEKFGVQRLQMALSRFRPVTYTGDMSLSQRQEALEVFTKSPEVGVMILSLKAGGVGLNLQSASYVFHFDRWWNPASELQAEDRTHRIGQTRGVNVYKYICEGTIEERIQQILLAKKALFSEYVDDVCLDLQRYLSEEDLFGLFDLQPPKRRRAVSRHPDFGEMSGPDFELYVKGRLEQYGYRVETTPASRDGGIDLIAIKLDELGMETTLLVQCKNWSSPAGPDVIRELNGVLPRDGRPIQGLVVCPAGFTPEAVLFGEKHHILLWGDAELFSL